MGAMKKKRKQSTARAAVKMSLDVFIERYLAILFAARDFVGVVAKAADETDDDPWVTVPQIARHLVEHKPATYIKTFGTDEPRELKEWRILSILRNAGYLGAWEALGMRTARGKGVSRDPKKRANLRVVK